MILPNARAEQAGATDGELLNVSRSTIHADSDEVPLASQAVSLGDPIDGWRGLCCEKLKEEDGPSVR
jgi:hypothetical protein